jgi:hypothetical protein
VARKRCESTKDPKSGVPTAVSTNAIRRITWASSSASTRTRVAYRGGTGDEARLAKVKVRATRRQVDQLLEWAARFEERTWAIESAGGLGYLLAQQVAQRRRAGVGRAGDPGARVRVIISS